MPEQLKLGKINKKINSTSSKYTTILTTTVLLKEPCSITSPIFILKAQYDSVRECNYAEWAGFYYWIDNIISLSNYQLEVHCTRDPLASFYKDIKGGAGLVQHCSDSSKCNDQLDDTRFGPDVIDEATAYPKTVLFGQLPWSINGTVVLSVINDSVDNNAGVTTYAMDFDNFIKILKGLGNIVGNTFAGYTTVVDLLKNAIPTIFANGSWRDLIVSCKFIPLDYSSMYVVGWTQVSELLIGGFRVSGLTMSAIQSGLGVWRRYNANANISHSTLTDYVPFVNLPKYKSLQLVTPSGYQEFNCPELYNKDTVSASLALDLMSGDYTICLKIPNTSRIIAEESGNVSTDILGFIAMNNNVSNILKREINALGTIAATVFGGGAAMTATAAAKSSATDGALLNGVPIQQYNNTTNGSNTNFNMSTLADGIKTFTTLHSPMTSFGAASSGSQGLSSLMLHGIQSVFYITGSYSAPEIIDYDPNNYFNYCNEYGYPCFRYYSLSDLVGHYVQCSGASIAAEGATRAELSTINSFVNSGLYLED